MRVDVRLWTFVHFFDKHGIGHGFGCQVLNRQPIEVHRAQDLENLKDEQVAGWRFFDIAEIEIHWGPWRHIFRVSCNQTEYRVWYNDHGERSWYRLIRPDPNLRHRVFAAEVLEWARMYGRMITE